VSWDQVALVAVGAVAGYGGCVVQAVIGDRRDHRVRCDEAARAARDAVDALRRLYYDAAADPRDLDEAAPEALPLVWDLRRDGALICDRGLRERIALVVRGLRSLNAIEQVSGERERGVAWHPTNHTWESLSGFLRGERLPPEPPELREHAAGMAEHDAWIEHNDRRLGR
jgi:hypothetical protein